MADEVVIDALPYFDQGYDEPGVRDAAIAMIDEETKKYKPTKNYLEDLPLKEINCFQTEVMKNEFARLEARQPMEQLNMKKYELPAPPASLKNDVKAWKECVENSQAQLMHQEVRMENLRLMLDHECNVWKQHNSLLEVMFKQVQKNLQHVKQRVQEVNWQRKSEHTTAGKKLHELEAKWVSLIGKNYEIEEAIMKLEAEIASKVENKPEEEATA